MAMRDSLRAEVSRYSKRSKHSIDGTVPGMPHYHSTSSSNGMAADAHVEPVWPRFDLYDPFSPRYEWDQPDYRPPDPWFVDLHVQPTPRERIAGPEAQAQVLATDAVRQQIEIHQAVSCVKDDRLEGILLDGAWQPPVPEPGLKHPTVGAYQITQEMLDALCDAAPQQEEMSEPVSDLMTSNKEAEQLPQGLELLVQEAMLQQNPNDLQNESFAQEQMMYDEEMKQLLDPFAMPGFGPG